MHEHVDQCADQSTIQASGTAEDEDDQHLGRTVETQRSDTRELRRLGEERTGNTGNASGQSVSSAKPRVDGRPDRAHPPGAVVNALKRETKGRAENPPYDEKNAENNTQTVDKPGSTG